uniref:hypothetical protein n=1 Tax=Salmonella sp. s58078 TaxID=3159699 RepID=UPI0039805CA8
MDSLNMFVMTAASAAAVTTTRRQTVVCKATAAKSSGGSEEKGLWDWILGGLQKEDQLLETDPILSKVEEPDATRKGTVSVSAPPKKKSGGGFGGLFAK